MKNGNLITLRLINQHPLLLGDKTVDVYQILQTETLEYLFGSLLAPGEEWEEMGKKLILSKKRH